MMKLCSNIRWERMPRWVKEESLGLQLCSFYESYLGRLSHYDVLMRPVWSLLDEHRASFGENGPVHFILRLASQANGYLCGVERPRSSVDRRHICGDIQKSVERLVCQLERLKVDPACGPYPGHVQEAIDDAIRKSVRHGLRCALGPSVDLNAAEHEVVAALGDPILLLKDLANGVGHWAMGEDPKLAEVMVYVSAELAGIKLGARHYEAAAALITAATTIEVFAETVQQAVTRSNH